MIFYIKTKFTNVKTQNSRILTNLQRKRYSFYFLETKKVQLIQHYEKQRGSKLIEEGIVQKNTPLFSKGNSANASRQNFGTLCIHNRLMCR